MATEPVAAREARPLTAADLERVIAIDQAHSGLSRHHFFERRFAAAHAKPEDFLLIGMAAEGRLLGFAIAHILRGEFGHKDAVAVFDAVGVDSETGARGVGPALLEALIEQCRERGLRAIESQVRWTNHDLLQFFGDARFRLAARMDLERPVAELREEIEEA